MRVAIEALVRSDIDSVWSAWTNPNDIKEWNAASDDWHTIEASLDIRDGGAFNYRMEAKDGSMGFDFTGTYRRVVPKQLIEYALDDGRAVTVRFSPQPNGVKVEEEFEAESENDVELQRSGWQAILDRFAQHVEGKHSG